MVKKLYRIKEGKMLCGVCTGIAEYFQIDVTLIRVGAVIAGFMGGGILAYIAAAFIIPEKPEDII